MNGLYPIEGLQGEITVFSFFSNLFAAPEYLLFFILILLGIFIFARTNRRLYWTRILILVLLVLAISEPYSLDSILSGGKNKLVILEDESNSYDLFGGNIDERFINGLKKKVGAKHKLIGTKLTSDIGEEIITSFRRGENVLLFSDGQINEGVNWNKVLEISRIENLSLNLFERDLKESDYSVKIVGPSKIGPDTEAQFTVIVSGTDNTAQRVSLVVDGKEVVSQFGTEIEYSAKFSEGYHELVASIGGDDFFEKNNVYYKSVKVVEKPKILLFGSAGTRLEKLLSKLYSVEVGGLYGLDKYHAVVIDDKPVDSFGDKVADLNKYVGKGNGLFVVGGKNSFERDGSYPGSKFEKLLPVEVGGTGKKMGDINVILLIDISSSVGAEYGGGNAADVAKALAVGVVEDVTDDHSLGVVAFNDEAYIIEPLGLLENKDRSVVESNIVSLVPEGYTYLGNGVTASVDMLKSLSGGKNIILFSDGSSQGETSGAINYAIQNNVKIYSVGIGTNPNNVLLKSISNLTGGTYYWAGQSHQLALVFGDPAGTSSGEGKVKIFDDSHFITEGLFPIENIYGMNKVLPKNAGRLLVTGGSGDPLLSVWRKGLGRVGVLSSDSGANWGGELYSGISSTLLSRSFSWVSGDPERKNEYFFEFNDARIGKEVEVTIIGGKPPEAEGFEIKRSPDGSYLAKKTVEEVGFFEFGDENYAVNYNDELENIGTNDEMKKTVISTGGKILKGENMNELESVLKENKTVIKGTKELFIWPLLVLAMAIFIVDVWFRTVSERKNI
ncbi:VWA domain-containing protein [Candidatus Woesearchaeota archaeon]|nr:VWA domain-containing protein [Candidatus Woesearchaeota archaeon]MBT4783014.1 VWA domain-containing protein [Candidatus Woesearchaeota archaeon]MBT5111662.1 VWA domain-containing protein [Candidatus Woesearchaeota archaeon]MBT5557753.1 VWA domain-containing protein [Candidatus Woesearchaeota archaeon]MBT6941564.1 VWA domain-containing protein [Candidatus Woesearchaeota archaeon]